MARLAKQLQRLEINGWKVDQMPNSWAERFAWEVNAISAEGYLITKHGFFSKRDAVKFAKENAAPITKTA